jgi:hypothetical protein
MSAVAIYLRRDAVLTRNLCRRCAVPKTSVLRQVLAAASATTAEVFGIKRSHKDLELFEPGYGRSKLLPLVFECASLNLEKIGTVVLPTLDSSTSKYISDTRETGCIHE